MVEGGYRGAIEDEVGGVHRDLRAGERWGCIGSCGDRSEYIDELLDLRGMAV